MKRITTPISEAVARDLKVGDEILLNGRVVLSRDIGHKFMVEKKPDWLKPLLEEAVIYHCGPVVAHWPALQATEAKYWSPSRMRFKSTRPGCWASTWVECLPSMAASQDGLQ